MSLWDDEEEDEYTTTQWLKNKYSMQIRCSFDRI